jgi:glycine cleavage system H protein
MVAIFVILTIAVCIGIDSILQWKKSKREATARRAAGQLVPAEAFDEMNVPADLFLGSGHTWVRVASSGRADVGLDGFAQRLLGRIDAVILPDLGKEVRRGDLLFALRQDNRRAAFASPIDGVVTATDQDVAWHPEAIHSDPYTEGRICSLRPKNLAANLKQLRMAEDARQWLKDEVRRFQEFFSARPVENMHLGVVLQDGGKIAGGVLQMMDEETWKQFNEIFLRRRAADTPGSGQPAGNVSL